MVLRGATTTATSIASATSAAVSAATSEAIAACSTSNDYDGRLGLRISAIFVILLGSMSGEQGIQIAQGHPPRLLTYILQVLVSLFTPRKTKVSEYQNGHFS